MLQFQKLTAIQKSGPSVGLALFAIIAMPHDRERYELFASCLTLLAGGAPFVSPSVDASYVIAGPLLYR
jgi:hypothetical protein